MLIQKKIKENKVFRHFIVPLGMTGPRSLFVGTIGDWTWETVYDLCDVDPYNAINSQGQPSYLSFFYYHILGNQNIQLEMFTIGSRIDVESHLYYCNAESLYCIHRISLEGTDLAPFTLEFLENPCPNSLYVITFNRWISRAEPKSNENLVKAAPKEFQYQHLPKLISSLSPWHIYKPAIQEKSFCQNKDKFFSLFSPQHVSYPVNPIRDINGVGLLYFASYFGIIEEGIYKVWEKQGCNKQEFLQRRITDQKICYLGNSDYSSTIEIIVKGWQKENEYIFDVELLRKHDQVTIAIYTEHFFISSESKMFTSNTNKKSTSINKSAAVEKKQEKFDAMASNHDTGDRIRVVIAEFLSKNSDDISLHHSFRDLGIDSVDVVEVIDLLQNAFRLDEYKISLNPSTLGSLENLGELASFLDKRLENKSTAPNSEIADNKFTQSLKDIPQGNCLVSKQIDRQVTIDGKDAIDFASCNYLGLDLHPKVQSSIGPLVEKWGTHPSWTRMVASPQPYEDLEKSLSSFVGAPTCLLFPTVAMLNLGIIPLIVGHQGLIICDVAAHTTIQEACELAQARGAKYVKSKYNNVKSLEKTLDKYRDMHPKLIAVDGVYSMTSDYVPLPEYSELAKKYDALLFVDDAHGLGVVGENPDSSMPYGYKGNGIVKYYGMDYVEDRILYVAGLSKSFSTLGAFITCFDESMRLNFTAASTYIFSGPIPVASLATGLAGVQVNLDEGDALRSHLYRLTRKLTDGARAMGYTVDNFGYFPIVFVVTGDTETTQKACQLAWEHGLLVTPAIFPIVPAHRGGLRFSLTAANTEEQIDQALFALERVKERW